MIFKQEIRICVPHCQIWLLEEYQRAQLFNILGYQERNEGTSSVTFEVLISKSEIYFINLFIFNCLTSNTSLFIFSCLTSNINLFNFNCLTLNFCFPKNKFFASRRERMFMDARPQSGVFNSTGKTMTCYLRDTNKFLRYCF